MNKNLKNQIKSNKPWIILMVGTPLVGKSTYIKDNIDGEFDYTLLSRDQTLLEVSGIDDYDKAWKIVNQKEVSKTLMDKFKDSNSRKDNVIIDMTNLSKKRRKYNLSFFDDSYFKIALVFDNLDDEEYKLRNDNRKITENKFIPYVIINNMKKSFQPVTKDEGFNLIMNIK